MPSELRRCFQRLQKQRGGGGWNSGSQTHRIRRLAWGADPAETTEFLWAFFRGESVFGEAYNLRYRPVADTG